MRKLYTKGMDLKTIAEVTGLTIAKVEMFFKKQALNQEDKHCFSPSIHWVEGFYFCSFFSKKKIKCLKSYIIWRIFKAGGKINEHVYRKRT